MQTKGPDLLWIGLMSVALATLAARSARAGFVGGVERFDGTAKDTATWEEHVNEQEVISQNDALIMTDLEGGLNSNSGEYTTRQLALLPGSAVSVRVTMSATGLASLYLTNNSRGTTAATAFDSYWTRVDIGAPSAQVERWIGANGAGSNFGLLANVSNPIGQTFKLEIVRPNSTDYTYRVYDALGAQLGSSSFVGGAAHPEALFISLDGHNGMTAMWDDVTVSGNVAPEPGALWALTGALPLLRRRQRDKRM
jgi:hypothetical protein